VVVAAATIALPQTLEWNIGRCIVALACLPWFLRRLAAARRPPEVDAADDAAGAAPEAPAAEAPAPEAPALDDPVAAMPAHRSRHDQETS